jgi:SAM-dependent methyltransferase
MTESEAASPPGETSPLVATSCAICGPGAASTLLYPPNFTEDDLTAEVFSARRLPDRIHYRMARCNQCGLVRSDPVVAPGRLGRLYAESTFDYDAEVGDIRATYSRYMDRLRALGGRQRTLLEVGCGNGFFLERALDSGYEEVRGVEPSAAAVAAASPRIQPHLVCDTMRPGLFRDDEFDAVCLFQVLDHVPDPGALLDACLQVLRPGGRLLCLNHNMDAVSARLLRERSPIIDIEHTYLYGPATMTRLFRDHGYEVLEADRVVNTYSADYLAHLFPLPRSAKRGLMAFLRATRLGRVHLPLPIGNMYLIAGRPAR